MIRQLTDSEARQIEARVNAFFATHPDLNEEKEPTAQQLSEIGLSQDDYDSYLSWIIQEIETSAGA